MPELYQSSSSPEEPSLLEEHIAQSVSRDRPRGQVNSASADATAAAIPTGDTSSAPYLYAANATIRRPSQQANALPAPARPPPPTATTANPSSSVYFSSATSADFDSRAATRPPYQPPSGHAYSTGAAMPHSSGHSRPHYRYHSPPQPHLPRAKSPYAYPETQSQVNRHYNNSQPNQGAGYNAYFHGPLQSAQYPHTLPHQPRAPQPYHSMQPSGYPPRTGSLPAYYSRRVLSAEEKELRRKVSHSAIEKRRRERTNAVLRSLQDMVPGLPKSGKIQKLEILEAAAEYIRRLKLTNTINRCECSLSDKECRANTTHKQACGTLDRQHLQPHNRHERGDSCSNTTETQDNSFEFSEVPDSQSRHVASPESAASEITKDGSGGDTLANPADVSETSDSPSSSGDPSAMKLNFLLT